jgi:hypothetical protein
MSGEPPVPSSGAPDFTHRIAGVRAWRVAPNLAARLGGLLWSANMLTAWRSHQELVANCSSYAHTPPQENCGCGVNAFYRPEGGLAYLPDTPGDPTFYVTGVVSGAGEVVLFEEGWRAARGKVEAIFDGPDLHRLPRFSDGEELGRGVPKRISLEMIAEAYDAQIIAPADYEAFCLENGLMVIDPDTL